MDYYGLARLIAKRVPGGQKHPRIALAILAFLIVFVAGPVFVEGWMGFWTDSPPIEVIRDRADWLDEPSLGVARDVPWRLVGFGGVVVLLVLAFAVAFGRPVSVANHYVHLDGQLASSGTLEAKVTRRIDFQDASSMDTPTDGDMWRLKVINNGPPADVGVYPTPRGPNEEPYWVPWRPDSTRREPKWHLATGQSEVVNLARQRHRNWYERQILDLFRKPRIELFSTSMPGFVFPRTFAAGLFHLTAEVWVKDESGEDIYARIAIALLRNGASPVVQVERL